MTQKTIKGKGYRNCKKGERAMAQSYYTACESKHLLFSYLGSCCPYSAALAKIIFAALAILQINSTHPQNIPLLLYPKPYLQEQHTRTISVKTRRRHRV